MDHPLLVFYMKFIFFLITLHSYCHIIDLIIIDRNKQGTAVILCSNIFNTVAASINLLMVGWFVD